MRQGSAQLRRELGYFRKSRHHMDAADAANAGFAIGSGSVEAANKVLGIIYLAVTEDRFLKRAYS
ncbi:MAG: hypothetical protein OXC17_12340 [Aestuariivita sp.]|nr:hypothetical protein [Aestuariivita sp.]